MKRAYRVWIGRVLICIFLSCNLLTPINGAYGNGVSYDDIGIASGSNAGASGSVGNASGGFASGRMAAIASDSNVTEATDSNVTEATDSDVEVPLATESVVRLKRSLEYELEEYEEVVSTFEELRTALSEDNDITTVYLGADIEIGRYGIRLPPQKKDIIIDGTWEGERYTLTEYRSSSGGDTIYINVLGVESVTIKNVDLIGKNYYSLIGVYDYIQNNVVVTYDNVYYNGPQLFYNVNGTGIIKDSRIEIESNGGSAAQELGEVTNLEFMGKSSVVHSSSNNYPVIQHYISKTRLTLHKDAEVTITAGSGSMFKGRGASATSHTDILLEEGAEFHFISTGKGPRFNDNNDISSMILKKDSKFVIEYDEGGTALYGLSVSGDLIIDGASLKITTESKQLDSMIGAGGNIKVMEGSELHLINKHRLGQNKYGLIRFYGSGKNLEITEPKSVILYHACSGKAMIQYNTDGSLNMTANRINYWPMNGEINGWPQFSWSIDSENVYINGTLRAGENGGYTVNETNYEGEPPVADNFKIGADGFGALSMGELPLEVDEYYEGDEEITGMTEPYAKIRITVNGTVCLETTADQDGAFVYTVDVEDGTLIENLRVEARHYFLYNEKTMVANEERSLRFSSVPKDLNFGKVSIPTTTITVEREDEDWKLDVQDSRKDKQDWEVRATLSSDMAVVDGEGLPVLEGAIIFIDESNEDDDITYLTLTTGEEVVVFGYVPEESSDSENTEVKWESGKGIQARIRPGNVYARPYHAEIVWILADAP